jgi:hypothetical protein
MSNRNSSETRVRPIFNELLDRSPTGDEWLGRLSALAMQTRNGGAFTPSGVGHLVRSETPDTHQARLGLVFERTVAPPGAFLEWLLRHPDRMQVTDRKHFSASGANAQKWRRKLFVTDARNRDQAIAEGVKQLAEHGAEGSGQEWWAFEGFTHIDCCLITDAAVLFIEGKRTETVSPATRWFQARSQLWRNVEAAQQFALDKAFGVILAVEQDGNAALEEADATLNESYPHLTDEQKSELSRHLLGFVTWSHLAQEFELPPYCLPETTADIHALSDR